MKFNFKKNWYYLVPVAIGAYLILRQFSKKNDPKGDAPPPVPPAPPAPPAPSSDFPLSKGTKNATVETLQLTLNTGLQAEGSTLLVVDGNFGSKTLAALQGFTGKSSIANQAELDALIAQMLELTSLTTDLDWGWQLLAAYNSGTYRNLVVKAPITLKGYTKNFEGKYIPNRKAINMPARSYSLADYAIKAVAKDGTMRIEVTNGSLAGIYYTPNGIDLKSTFDIT
jgi:hypothetical protein